MEIFIIGGSVDARDVHGDRNYTRLHPALQISFPSSAIPHWWRFGVAVTALGVSTKLLHVGPG